MKLQEFVRQSLVEIVAGVREASVSDPSVTPSLKMQDHAKGGPVAMDGRPTFLVEFDVAVTTSREAEISGEAKGGLISVISGSVDSSLNSKNELMNRLKFSVPISYSKR